MKNSHVKEKIADYSRGSYGCGTKLACLRPPSNGPRKLSLSQSCGGGLAGAGAPELAGAGVAPSLLASAPWLAMVCGRSRALLTRSQCTKTAAGTNIHSTMQNSMHGVAAGLLTCLRLMPSRRRRRRSGPLSPCALSPAQSYSRSTV